MLSKESIILFTEIQINKESFFRFTGRFSDLSDPSRAEIYNIEIFNNGLHFRLLRRFSLTSFTYFQ